MYKQKIGILTASYQPEQNTLTMTLTGSFELAVVSQFKKVFLFDQVHPDHYLLDFHACCYIDSAVVAFLLEFCTFAKQHHADISIINMNDDALESFRLLNLHKFFKPEYNSERQRVDWVYRND